MKPISSKAYAWVWVALLGFSATLMGAMAAHANWTLEAAQQASLHTGIRYHQLYSALILATLLLDKGATKVNGRWVFYLWSLGILAFSGSIYALVATPWTWLWPITPIGGLLLMLGWGVLGVKGWQYARSNPMGAK